MNLEDILQVFEKLTPQQQQTLTEQANAATKGQLWVPNAGPQTDAYFCEADELFYGGQAGGGKTDLVLGLAMTSHQKSLVLRRTNKEATGLVERAGDILGTRDGWNSQLGLWRIGERTLEVSGCQLEADKQKFKGTPHDLIGYDEVSDFLESQYLFINAWNRSTTPGQRCRVVATGNPPTQAEGLWVIRRWAAWLDPRHPNPAKPGELRWFTTDEKGEDTEVEGPGPHLIAGEWVIARSRTFLPAKLSDNPDLAATNYGSVLAALPPELRAAYRDGRFDLGLKDRAFQTIPTAWVLAAQARWTERPPPGVPMCAMGVDASGGSTDPMVIAPRHDGWFARMVSVPGAEIPMDRSGSFCAGTVISHRRDNALVIVDMGGGYGGPVYEHLRDNQIPVKAYKGSTKAAGRTSEGLLGFQNQRSAALWRLREALDPDQSGGSVIALPPSPTLVADLTASTYEVKKSLICVESKEDVCKRLGRSTNEGDAVAMCWTQGLKRENIPSGDFARHRVMSAPKVILGHAAARRR